MKKYQSVFIDNLVEKEVIDDFIFNLSLTSQATEKLFTVE